MSRMNQRSTFAAVALLGLLSACSTPRNAAPVVERSPSLYTGTRPADASRASDGSKAAVPGRGYYMVRRGDSLLRIAQQNSQTMRDLVAWNNLANANDIKVDQVLRVLPPDGSSMGGNGMALGAGEGAQTSSIASSSGVEVRPLNVPPAPGGNTAAGATASSAFSAAAVHKSSPRGEKRPYTESVMEEMQRGDGAAAASTASARPAEKGMDKGSDKGSEKPADKAAEKPAEHAAAAADAAGDGGGWAWPAEGKVTGTFANSKKGIDIGGKSGQPVMAARAGTVMYASSVRGYGNLVIIRHTTTLLTAYAHNKTMLVKEGQTVRKGQKIAEMGNTDTDSVKLHFEVRQDGKPADPAKFLPARQ
ncbi:MAG: peptidoglycan DD-metalloendopeptidase family protein [Janthinobacterium lividum]